ncbi:MAG TPA: DUF2510 domain-containing protein, partial [Acidimicrobiales bacterium]|nr:DUF2510 domain-containing protein [Acidimicrobiales bacterium]
MGDIEPGWYDDTEDPTLARWWDGRAWTTHTLVIADQVPGAEPPPPPAPPTRFPVPPPPHQWLDDPSYEEEAAADPDTYGPIEAPRVEAPWVDQPWPADAPTAVGPQTWGPVRDHFDDGGAWNRLDDGDDGGRDRRFERRRRIETGDETLRDRVAVLPVWVRVGLPILAAVLLVGALASAGTLRSDGDGDQTETADTAGDDRLLGEAADRALEVADVSWFTRQGFLASIPPTCTSLADDDADRVADRVILLGYDPGTAGRLIAGLEAGAEVYCPDEVAAHPTFFDEVFQLVGASDVTTTTTVVPDVTTTITTPTTAPSTTTTRKRATPAPTTPTTQPPATTTPTSQPPATTTPTTPTTQPTTTTTEATTTGGPPF